MRTNLRPAFGRQKKKDLYCTSGTFLAFYPMVFLTTQPPGWRCDICGISPALYIRAPQAQTRFKQLDFCKCYVSFSSPLAKRVLFCLAVHKIISDGVYSEHTNTLTYRSYVEHSIKA